MKFEFSTASKIVFERGAIKKLPSLCRGLGSNIMILAGGSTIRSGIIDKITGALKESGMEAAFFQCESGEPTVGSVNKAVLECMQSGADAIIAIGGGSVMDTAKAVSGVVPNGGRIRDYLEGVGTGAKIINSPLPFIAVPTTSGTGTEVTKNAVVMSKNEKFKKSIRDDRLLARVALLDPELTISVPKNVTASSGMDAICQLIESFTAKPGKPFLRRHVAL